MKGYKFLVPIFLVVIYGLSIYMMCSGRQKVKEEYNTYLQAAREKRADGIYTDAEQYYMKASEVMNSIDLQVEIGELYREMGDEYKAVDLGEELLATYKDDIKAYEFMFDLYYDSDNKLSCFQIYDDITKRGLKSKTITDIIEGWKFAYYFETREYLQVGDYKDGICIVEGKKRLGYVNTSSTIVASGDYSKLGPYNENLAPIVTSQGEAYYIDTAGEKKKVIKNAGAMFELGMIENGIFSVFNGYTWAFYNEDGTKISEDYDKVSNMSNGIAAVMNDRKWSIINSSGEVISEETYDSVVMDDNKIAMHNDRIFVKSGNKYYMLDKNGKKVNETEYQNADCFRSGGYAAVKIDGKWGYVDASGNVVISPQYDGARSFSCGLAAVKIGDKWGFINEEGTVVIEPLFEGAKDFTEQGTVFVQQGAYWNMLKLYRSNH